MLDNCLRQLLGVVPRGEEQAQVMGVLVHDRSLADDGHHFLIFVRGLLH